ncbi:MAG: hypothetical protein ACI4Q4_02465 [Oscillospiraceae bacterium]
MKEEYAIITFLSEYVTGLDTIASRAEAISAGLSCLIQSGVFTENEISVEIYRMSGIYISEKRIRTMSKGTVLFFYPPIKKRRNHNG